MMNNSTPFEHSLIALAIQYAMTWFIDPWAAGAVAIALLLGREIAQHEYKLARDRGWQWGDEKPVSWHEGLWRGWTKDSLLDVLIPLVFCTGLAVLSWWLT